MTLHNTATLEQIDARMNEIMQELQNVAAELRELDDDDTYDSHLLELEFALNTEFELLTAARDSRMNAMSDLEIAEASNV